MNAIMLIARRELAAYLRSMSGYVIIAVMLLVDGLCFNAFAMAGPGRRSSEVLGDFFFFTSGWTMVCGILLSMRLLAEERQTGTLQLLYSSPVRDVEIVLGKYLSGMAFLSVFLLSTLYMPLLVLAYGKVSFGQLAVGYLGLVLVGSATVAMGVLGSSVTKSQVIAVILSGVMAVFITICWWIARVSDRPITQIATELAWHPHFKPFQSGLLHLQHAAYFGLITFVALFAATRVLEARRWK